MTKEVKATVLEIIHLQIINPERYLEYNKRKYKEDDNLYIFLWLYLSMDTMFLLQVFPPRINLVRR